MTPAEVIRQLPFAEVVAKAIYESQCRGKANRVPWRDKSRPDLFWDSYVTDATAAIEAIICYEH